MPLQPAALRPAVPTQGAPGQPGQTMGQELLGSLSPGGRQAIEQIEIEQREREAQRAEQERLEDENGVIGTMALQAAKGVLGAVTAPGSLLAAGLEGTGSVLGSDTLERFGRELGEAATGEAAVQALAFGGKAVTEGPEAGVGAHEEALQKLHDQQRAWPTLSTMSSMAGNAAAALATGGAAAMAQGGLKAGSMLGLSAYEGAAGGAQGAYEQSAPIRDVLSSTLLGAMIGTAIGGAGELAGAGVKAISRRITPETEAAIEALARGEAGSATGVAEFARDQAEGNALKAFADRASELKKIVGRKTGAEAQEELERVARDGLDFRFQSGPRAGQSILEDPTKAFNLRKNDEIPFVVEEAKDEMGARVGNMMREIDQRLQQQVVPPIPARDAASVVEDVGLGKVKAARKADGVGFVDGIRKLGGDIVDEGPVGRAVENTFGQRIPTPREFADAFSVKGYKTTLEVSPRMNGIEVRFRLNDAETGGFAGSGTRRFTRRQGGLTAVHDDLYLQEAAQRKGIGTALTRNAEQLYPRWGVNEIDIPRAAEIGRYSWARAGFKPDAGDLKKIQNAWTDYLTVHSPMDALTHTADSLEDIARHPKGKEFLLSSKVEPYGARKTLRMAPDVADDADAPIQVSVRRKPGETPEISVESGRLRLERAMEKGAGEVEASVTEYTLDDAGKVVAEKTVTRPVSLDPKPLAAPPAAGGLDLQTYLRRVKENIINPLEEKAGGLGGPEAERALLDINRHLDPLGKRLGLTELIHTPDGAVQRPLKVGSEKWWQAVEELEPGTHRIGFSDLRAQQQDLAERVYPKPISGVAPPAPRSMKDLQKLERETASFLEDEGSRVLRDSGVGDNVYRETMRQYRSIKVLSDATKVKRIAQLGNRAISLTDYGTGIGLGMLTGGPGGAIAGLIGSVGHKWARENGRALAAVTLTRIAKALEGDVSRGVQSFGRALSYGVKGVRAVERATPHVARELSGSTAASASELWNKRRTIIERTLQQDPAVLMAEAQKQSPGMPDGLIAHATIGAQERLSALVRDMPKARKDIRGPAFEKMSTNDVRIANGMFEATFDPMSIFEDYRSGRVDYDKIQYVWKQYPGLQQVMQAGVIDMITSQMDDSAKAAIPDGTLTQMDYFFGFGGALQPSVSAALSRNMTMAAGVKGPEEPQPQATRPLGETPAMKPTRIGRMMG